MFGLSGGREPFRALPAEGLTIYGAGLGQLGVQGTDPFWPARWLFRTGTPRGEGQLIVLMCFGASIVRVRKSSEPARVEFQHVDFSVAVQHPLRQVLAAAGTLRDTEGAAAAHPEILQMRGRAEQRRTVGGVRNGAIDYPANAGRTENGDTLDDAFHPRRDAIE